MDDLKVAEKARQGAAWVREHGFTQGNRWDGSMGHCALGVIERVYGLFGKAFAEFDPAACQLVAALAITLPEVTCCPGLDDVIKAGWKIAIWNNIEGRTQDEVADLFDSTALALEVRALSHEATREPREVVAVA